MNSIPTAVMATTDSRKIDFHHYQIFYLIIGTGYHTQSSPSDLSLSSTTGSGPLYNIRLESPSGGDKLLDIQIGDSYVSKDVSTGYGATTSWYRYDITNISARGTIGSGYYVDLTVKYVSDSQDQGSASPATVYVATQTTSATTEYDRSHFVSRQTSPAFLFCFP